MVDGCVPLETIFADSTLALLVLFSVLHISHLSLESLFAKVHPGQFHIPGIDGGKDSGVEAIEDEGKGLGLKPSSSHLVPQTVQHNPALSYRRV
jgi:hypothetical protein